MAKQYGKNIDLHKKLNNRPSNQISAVNQKVLKNLVSVLANKGTLNNKGGGPGFEFLPYADGSGHLQPSIFTTGGKSLKDFPHFKNPFYNYLQTASIATLTLGQTNKNTGATSISITSPSKDYLLRKKDKFYLFNRLTFNYLELTANADLMATDSTISITSFDFTTAHHFPPGSFVVADNQRSMETISNSPQFKRFDITNAEYKTLNTAPYTLLGAETGVLHIPLNATIVYTHGADELVNAGLYIGHGTATSIGQYWASIHAFAYRNRTDMLYQLSPGIYGASTSTGYKTIPVKSTSDNGVGNALSLYSSANFASPASTISVFLYYKSVVL